LKNHGLSDSIEMNLHKAQDTEHWLLLYYATIGSCVRLLWMASLKWLQTRWESPTQF